MSARKFTITADNEPVTLGAKGRGEVSFTVSNTSTHPMRGQARLAVLGSTQLDWLHIKGEVERNFSGYEAHQFVVQMTPPADTASGMYKFRLDVFSVQNPDDDFAMGPVVSFQVAERDPWGDKPPPNLKWLFWVLLSALGVVGVVVLAVALKKPALEAAFGSSVNKGFAPLAVQFTNRTAGEFMGVLWSFGDGATSTDRDPQHTFSQSGSYIVALLVTDEKHQSFATNTVTVMEHAHADFEASPDAGPAPLKVSFDDQSTGDDLRWHWDFGNGQTATNANPLAQKYSRPGNYPVRLTVTGPAWEGSESNESIKMVVVRVVAPSQADFTATPTRGERPLRVKFTDRSAGNPNSWQWQFGDGRSASERNPVHVYSSAGNYNVTLKVAGPGGEANVTKSRFLVVNEPLRTVPNVVGRKLAEARKLIMGAGLAVGKVEDVRFPLPIGALPLRHLDKVVSQDPTPNRRVRAGSKVNLKHIHN